MGADWLQGGGLADDGAVRAQLGGFGKIARASHAGLFVGGGQNIQRFFQRGDVDIAQGVENKGEKAFHIGRAEAVEFVIVFGEGERVARPAASSNGTVSVCPASSRPPARVGRWPAD